MRWWTLLPPILDFAGALVLLTAAGALLISSEDLSADARRLARQPVRALTALSLACLIRTSAWLAWAWGRREAPATTYLIFCFSEAGWLLSCLWLGWVLRFLFERLQAWLKGLGRPRVPTC